MHNGFGSIGKCAMPSFTNPNNVSIITGVPPAVHGISGNYYLDRKTGETHMVLDSTLLRGETILSELAKRGYRIAAVTAKDKLRRILSYGIDHHICFSSEKADECIIEVNGQSVVASSWLGKPAPNMYSGELSLYVLDAGLKLLSEGMADVFYLTLSDYIQHKHAPGSPESDHFYKELDARVGKFLSLGAVVGMTGDHGMSDKCGSSSEPNVMFLQDLLEKKYGEGSCKVICPITDPFVGHHGALGSFVRVYVMNDELLDKIPEMIDYTKSLHGMELVLSGEDAAKELEQPIDREGDFVVVSVENAVIGARSVEHDLSKLHGERLRSHGGLSEQPVPVFVSRPYNKPAETSMGFRNFDIFQIALNSQ